MLGISIRTGPDDYMGKCYQGNEADQTTFCHLLLLDSLLVFYTLYPPNRRTEYILCLRFSKTLSFCFAHKETVFGLWLCGCVFCGSEDTQPKSSASHLEAQPKGRRGGFCPHWNEFMMQKSWHTKTGDKGWQDDAVSNAGHLLPHLMTWVRFQGSTMQKERTNSHTYHGFIPTNK